MSLVKVPNTPFVRDTNSMAIINVDSNAKAEYYEKAKMASRQKEQINKMKEDISTLKNDISEIKNLMQQLINKQ